MAEKQKLKCKECGAEFEYDPNLDESDESVMIPLNKSFKNNVKHRVFNIEVVAYLTCPNGHIESYKVKKDYK